MSAIYRNGKWYGKDNGHIIMNNAGLELKPRATLQFGGDLSTTDDNTNERTVIKPHEISPEEWDDIVNLLPGGVSNNGIVIDTRGNEYIVGKYIESDGTIKPIYQKTINCGKPSHNQWLLVPHDVTNIDAVCNVSGGLMDTSTGSINGPGLWGSAQQGMSLTCDRTKAGGFVYFPNISATWILMVTIKYTKTTD